MSAWKIILATLVIFCSGFVVGMVAPKNSARRADAKHPFPGASTNAHPSASHLMQREFLRRMDQDLNLTPEQRVSIEKILKDSQEHTKEIREKIAPEMREEVKKVRDEIRAQLNSEQLVKFEEKLKTQRKPDDSLDDLRRKFPKEGGPRRPRTNAPAPDGLSPTNR